jgi:hypothetical protein
MALFPEVKIPAAVKKIISNCRRVRGVRRWELAPDLTHDLVSAVMINATRKIWQMDLLNLYSYQSRRNSEADRMQQLPIWKKIRPQINHMALKPFKPGQSGNQAAGVKPMVDHL